MRLIITEEEKKYIRRLYEQNSNYGFWDKVIDFFMPDTPVKDGRDLLKKFDEIIGRRIEYNKKNNLPLETLTAEEKSFREKISKATPNLGYPSIFGLSKIVQDINQGKNIRPEEIEKYKNPGYFSSQKMLQDIHGVKNPSDKEVNSLLDKREELKRMWLGIDEPSGDTKGFWVKSEFKPSSSKDSNAVYFKPKDIPRLTTQQFDELYNVIMKTRLPDGRFPGGNSNSIIENYDDYKFLTLDLLKKLTGDDKSSIHSLLGNFKFGAGKDGEKYFISIFDEWDLFPPSAENFGVNVQKYGKTPLIYYRIYR